MKLFQFVKKLINMKSNESSKRFVALSITGLVIYATINFTNEENVELIVAELLSFILVLMGVTVWETIKKQ